MLTQTNDIQSRLEDLLKKEEQRGAQLKQQLDDLTKKLNNQNSGPGGGSSIKFGDNVKLHIGNSKFDKLIRSNSTYEDFIQPAKVSIGTDTVGFVDENERIVWLRTNEDIRLMFRWYFSQKPAFIHVVAVQSSDVQAFAKMNLRKEVAFQEGFPTFKCQCMGADGPLIFLAFQPSVGKNDGFTYLNNIFGSVSSLLFVDDAGDTVTVDSDESWEYCLETGKKMTQAGKYPLLIVGM